jgi:putative dehydrogenase
MKVAVIGLGSMGMGAALNLLRAGHDVVGCEPREAGRAEFAAAGGSAVATPAEIPADRQAVVVFVVNAAQTDAVLFGAQGCAAALAAGSVILCCTTVAPEYARQLAARLRQCGLSMLDAPVSGGAVGAREGTMTVMASGEEAAFAAAQPVLDAIASKVWRLGDAAGIGSTVKMVNQLLAGVHIATAAEALALGIRAGADPRTLFDVISTSAGSSWMWQNRIPHILDVKDLGIVLDQARALTFPLPMASAAHQLFLAAAASGHGGSDDAFVIRFWQALAGIKLPD